ncbi:MAG: MOSC domain-containing protein [Microthrixaceae bacterium]
MQVSELWRYPVKSMMGESVEALDIDDGGVIGDRGWAVRDEVRGGIRGAKKIGALMDLSARYTGDPGGPVEIDLPDGSTTASADGDVNDRLSSALEHDVTLWPLMPADDLDHYRRGAPDSDDLLEELRAIFGRLEDEPLPDLSVFPPEIMEFESPPGTYLDAFPLLVLTTSALKALGDSLPESMIDVKRFRPNVVIDTGGAAGHPELAWEGKRLRLGDAELDLTVGCPRCVMVTRQVGPEIPPDRGVLRHIVAELNQNLGIYANVTKPGEVSVGDTAELLD